MAERRPGGLTALAVLNFVFGGLGLLAMLALFALLKVADDVSGGEATKAVGSGVVYLSIGLSFLAVALLIASGVGYLGQKKSGRMLGNAYAIISLTNTGIALAVVKAGFGIGTIIGLIYPVLTLILLNSTFKDDLVN